MHVDPSSSPGCGQCNYQAAGFLSLLLSSFQPWSSGRQVDSCALTYRLLTPVIIIIITEFNIIHDVNNSKFRSVIVQREKNAINALMNFTMSMTILRRVWCCFAVRFWNILQPSSETSLKATARWWFSRTDSSLYIRASSEPSKRKN